MASVIFTHGKLTLISQNGWVSNAEYGVLLASNQYEPAASHRYVSSVEGEIEGKGYARQSLEKRDVAEAADRVEFRAAGIRFRALDTTESYRWVVVFRKGSTDKDSELICALDMGEEGIPLRGREAHKIKWSGKSGVGRILSL